MKTHSAAATIRNIMDNNRKSIYKFIIIGIILIVTLTVSIFQGGKKSEIIYSEAEVSGESGKEEPAESDFSPAQEDEGSREEAVTRSSQAASTEIGYADISGAVKVPGVYRITNDTRLYELIDKAGGLTDQADLDAINQASFVEDGMKIIIPEIGGEGGIIEGASGPAGASSSGQDNGLININTADKEQLKALPGIGDAYADRILEYREQTRFQSIEEIKNVKGIGDATFEKLKDRITV